jgi:hypothetical protein
MIVFKVYFTGLEFDPSIIANRWHRGVIPLEWRRYRFFAPKSTMYPVNKMNKWLYANTESRWSIWMRTVEGQWEINLAFEKDFDAMTFVMSDGKSEAFKDS